MQNFQSPSHHRSPQSEIHPNDSASVVDEDHSVLGERGRSAGSALGQNAPLPIDDGTYIFKFRTPSGRTHRFQARQDNVENIREIVTGKLAVDPFFSANLPEDAVAPNPNDFQLAYTDNDGDTVLMTADTDVTHAVSLARAAKTDRVVLFIHGGKGWDDAGAGDSDKKASAVAAAAAIQAREVEKSEEGETTTSPPPPAHAHPVHTGAPRAPKEDDIMGIPRDLLLPASLGFLGVAIVSVFIASRLTRSSY
jgi:hypothetical protein